MPSVSYGGYTGIMDKKMEATINRDYAIVGIIWGY